MNPLFHKIVSNAFKRNGGVGQYVNVTEGSYDPSTGTMTNVTTSRDISVCVFDYPYLNSGVTNLKNSLIKETDRQCLIIPFHKDGRTPTTISVNPNLDKIVINNIQYSIIAFKEINPSGTDAAMYECYIRGG